MASFEQRIRDAKKQERIRKAAPALLEALDAIVNSDRAIHLQEQDFYNAIAAIKLARGEE